MEPTVLTDGTNLIIHGHTHLPSYEFSDHITYLNPGSCGPHRPEKPICFCTLDLSGNEPKPKFIDFEELKGKMKQ